MAITKNGVSIEGQIEQETFEIENHLHNDERWLGLAAAPSGETHRADVAAGPFQLVSGNDDWGTAVQVLGSEDTPIRVTVPPEMQFDFHRILVTDASASNQLYYIRIICGASAAAGLSAGTWTMIAIQEDLGTSDHSPVDIINTRCDTGTKVWAQVKAVGASGPTIDFVIGVHEYPR